ncbi:MAG: phosphoglucosamine mutase [Clostridiales bacterium]|nr:phosphoglucosamine mutase [Clostridiales bacterium]MDD7347998.1 phosphoglucosamine mutase [Clostridiales bacterium]MDY4060559.1 phosphoglucosamine mutase [Anaerovoracaceae bacterium]
MGKLFGTDGVRGVANVDLTPTLAFKLGMAGATVLKKSSRRPVFVIGMDTRISGDLLENAITAGILSVGGNVIKVGVVPTPAVALLARHYGADAGIVISASHNPFEYNGIKFFNGDGFKLDDSIEEKIEKLISEHDIKIKTTKGDEIGKCIDGSQDALKFYEDFLADTMDRNLKGLKVVLDCANGASFQVAPDIYRRLGADVTVIGNDPDGLNINDNIGSTHPEKLQQKVVEAGADIGLAFDGDADRLIVVDEKGMVVDGDKIICLCAKMLKDSGELVDNRVTATVMSNIGFHKFCEKNGISVDVTKVGDRYVLESMLETGCIIGGEQSGHIIFLNHTTTGDGVLSSLQFLKILLDSGEALSELAKEVELFPQVLENARVANKNKELFLQDGEILKEIAKVENAVRDDGRLLIRPSGTEPVVRVMIEGKDIELIHKLAVDLADLITKKYA